MLSRRARGEYGQSHDAIAERLYWSRECHTMQRTQGGTWAFPLVSINERRRALAFAQARQVGSAKSSPRAQIFQRDVGTNEPREALAIAVTADANAIAAGGANAHVNLHVTSRAEGCEASLGIVQSLCRTRHGASCGLWGRDATIMIGDGQLLLLVVEGKVEAVSRE